jgi:CDP-L-myo-inositol myo-inositolphosphotransferase
VEAATRARLSIAEADTLLRAQARAIIAATGKPGDGIVSRTINRPISQAMTRLLLQLGPVRPYQATFGTIAVSLAMAIALLFFPGYQGQLWGGLLFQMASIVDGVDGEIARATFRTTPLGATFDSLVDATTNLSFFACLMINLYLLGDVQAALVGFAALFGLAGGMTLLGITAVSNRGPVTFNAVKERLASRPSRLKTWLTWFTMRDFYALFAATVIALGFAVAGAYIFATIVTGWLVVVVATLLRRAPSSLASQSLDG